MITLELHYNPHKFLFTFLRIFPRMWAILFSPSKHWTSKWPLPKFLVICPYSERANAKQNNGSTKNRSISKLTFAHPKATLYLVRILWKSIRASHRNRHSFPFYDFYHLFLSKELVKECKRPLECVTFGFNHFFVVYPCGSVGRVWWIRELRIY